MSRRKSDASTNGPSARARCSSTAMAMSVFVLVVVVVVVVLMIEAVMVMAMVMLVIVVVMVAVGTLVRPLGAVRGHPGNERGDVALERRESRGLQARAFIHVELAVHLDLQAVAARLRIRECAHQLDALVRVVHLHGVAHPPQRLGNERGEAPLACGAVA